MAEERLHINAPEGRVVMYTGSKDAALEADPFLDLSRIIFHSGLDYIGFEKITLQHTVPHLGQGEFRSLRIPIQAHGKNFTPITFAILRGWPNADGTLVDLPIGGGLLLDFYGQRPGDGGVFTHWPNAGYLDKWSTFWGRVTGFNNSWQQKAWVIGAGADATDLVLWVDQSVWNDSGSSYPETTLTIDYYVGNRGIDGNSGDPAPSAVFSDRQTGVQITSTRLSASGSDGSVFDSDNEHIYENDLTPDFQLPSNGRGAAFDRSLVRYAQLAFTPNWRFNITTYRSGGSQPSMPPTTYQAGGLDAD